MQNQTITQTLNIVVGNNTPGNLAETGSQLTTLLISGLILIIISIFIWRFTAPRIYRLKSASRLFSIFIILTIFSLLAVTTLGLSSKSSQASATPTLTLGVGQTNLNITIPKGGGTATATTSLTTGTTNSSGYKLTAQLTAPEPGIAIALKGGAITTSTPLTANATPLTLKTTTATSSNDQTEVTLAFTIDGSVTPGTKELKLNYQIADNEPSAPPTPTTMQSMTSAYCSTMEVYDGTNEDAVISLTDSRGGTTQTYQVAKLADNKCWMLNNLKLGSTSAATLLTPQDTDIASDFTLPQLTTTGTADPDNPGAYGPVPNDTGTGATNYGYLYNWPAVTAGESQTSHPETAGNAPHSICPKGWRLPTSVPNQDFSDASGDFPDLDRAFGGNGIYAENGEPNIAKWQSDGPFKGTFAGYWYEGFVNQGDGGGLWSSSADPGDAGSAMGAFFGTDGVYPLNGVNRDVGSGVRCLL